MNMSNCSIGPSNMSKLITIYCIYKFILWILKINFIEKKKNILIRLIQILTAGVLAVVSLESSGGFNKVTTPSQCLNAAD